MNLMLVTLDIFLQFCYFQLKSRKAIIAMDESMGLVFHQIVSDIFLAPLFLVNGESPPNSCPGAYRQFAGRVQCMCAYVSGMCQNLALFEEMSFKNYSQSYTYKNLNEVGMNFFFFHSFIHSCLCAPTYWDHVFSTTVWVLWMECKLDLVANIFIQSHLTVF